MGAQPCPVNPHFPVALPLVSSPSAQPPPTAEAMYTTCKKEWTKKKEKRVAENVALSREGLYKCGKCFQVKPDEDFPAHVPTIYHTGTPGAKLSQTVE